MYLCKNSYLFSLALLAIVFLNNLEPADAGLSSYLPSFNPFYWLGSRKNATATPINRSDDRNFTAILVDKNNTINFSLEYRSKDDPTIRSGQNRFYSNGTKVPAPTIAPVLVTETTAKPITTTTTLVTTTILTTPSGFSPGSIINMFTTQKPKIIFDKRHPNQARKFKIIKNGKLFDAPSSSAAASNLTTSDSNRFAVAFDSDESTNKLKSEVLSKNNTFNKGDDQDNGGANTVADGPLMTPNKANSSRASNSNSIWKLFSS